MNKLITKKEASQILSTSVRTVERIVASGKLVKIKLRGSVKFRLADVLKLVEKGC
jgi:excisionase family DNA binding protein